MNWTNAITLTAGRSGNAGRSDYVSISRGARLRCSPMFVAMYQLGQPLSDGLVLYYAAKERAFGLRFCEFRKAKKDGARRMNLKGAALELRIGAQLREAGVDPAVVHGKYNVTRVRMGRDWGFDLRLDERLA